jgi:hypothetical protein
MKRMDFLTYPNKEGEIAIIFILSKEFKAKESKARYTQVYKSGN